VSSFQGKFEFGKEGVSEFLGLSFVICSEWEDGGL
jgi:hypothetical protein